MHSMHSFPAALFPPVHLFLPQLLHVTMGLWATQVPRYNQSKWAWWYLGSYVETANAIGPSLTKLFNCSIACGHPPTSWKTSFVVPIPKIPRASSTSDYRPISLLSTLSKVLERHFHFSISELLSIHYPLANCQWGFQPKKSTVSALLHTTHEWLTHLESGSEIGAVFFDFKRLSILSLICPYYPNWRILD